MVLPKRPYARGMSWGELVAVQTVQNPETGCLEWIGAKNGRGYGVVKREGVVRPASRWAYWYAYGPVGKSLVVRHTCDNPPCVNPEHLILGTQAENISDSISRGRFTVGVRNGNAKVNPDKVREIRRRYASGEGPTSIGRDFGLTATTVIDISKFKTWKHVGESE